MWFWWGGLDFKSIWGMDVSHWVEFISFLIKGPANWSRLQSLEAISGRVLLEMAWECFMRCLLLYVLLKWDRLFILSPSCNWLVECMSSLIGNVCLIEIDLNYWRPDYPCPVHCLLSISRDRKDRTFMSKNSNSTFFFSFFPPWVYY